MPPPASAGLCRAGIPPVLKDPVMPLLLLARHAEAVQLAPGGDYQRPLSIGGWAAAARLGAHLRVIGLLPDLILFSPARRARETLIAILQGLAAEPKACEPEPLLYNADAETLLELVAQGRWTAQNMLVIGHNPGLGEFAAFLTGGNSAVPARLPAPCLAAIRLPDWSAACEGGGELEFFLDFSTSAASQDTS